MSGKNIVNFEVTKKVTKSTLKNISEINMFHLILHIIQQSCGVNKVISFVRKSFLSN